MTPRERMINALEFRPVDIVPLQICGSAGGHTRLLSEKTETKNTHTE